MNTVKDHPGVSFCDAGRNQASDYRYYVELKEGWLFKYGKAAGCGCLFFNSLADFIYAEPAPEDEQEEG